MRRKKRIKNFRKAYMVYVDYQEDRVIPENVEFFRKSGDAIRRFNELIKEFKDSSIWKFSDDFNIEIITNPKSPENYILFVNESSMEAYVSIHTFDLK